MFFFQCRWSLTAELMLTREINQIKDLLALKQQQASVLQAWQSGKEAEEMARQGQSIMMFTVITIIFVRLW